MKTQAALTLATLIPAAVYASNTVNAENISDILSRAPLEQTSSSFGLGLSVGLDAGSMHTEITTGSKSFDSPEGLSGSIAEVNAAYAISLPLQLYTSLEFAFDGRSSLAKLKTSSANTSYAYRLTSTYNGSLAGGWLFNRGDILYLKAGILKSKIKRTGSSSQTSGSNFDRSYRDIGQHFALGFMMPTDQYSYLRYELTHTPSFGEFSNELGNSSFKYNGSSIGFKLGYNFFFSPFYAKPTDYQPLNINGPYASLGLKYQSAQIDFQNKVSFAEGTQTRVEQFVRPASSTQYNYKFGYSNGFNSQNIYLSFEYQQDQLLSYNKKDNHFKSEQEDFYYRPYQAKSYSLVFGYRPHPSDLIFVKAGSTALEIHRLDASNFRNIINKTQNKGTLFGFGIETSLNSYLSWLGEYNYSLYEDKKIKNNTISPTNHTIATGLVIRL